MDKDLENLKKRLNSIQGLDLERIKQVDRQAKLYDRMPPSTNNDKGLTDSFDNEGNLHLDKPQDPKDRIVNREKRIAEAYEKQRQEAKEILFENYKQRKENIIMHMRAIINEFEVIDKIMNYGDKA